MGQKKDSKSEKGVLETIREVNRKDRMKRISSESERIKKAAHEKDLADEAYRKELQKDKIELIKIKQGIKEEDEIKQDETKYTFLQKVGAFFYCNKPMVITASFFISVNLASIAVIVTPPLVRSFIIFFTESTSFFKSFIEVDKSGSVT